MSCHQSWDGFVRGEPPTPGFSPPIISTEAQRRGDGLHDLPCCHLTTIDEASDFHNLFEAADSHSGLVLPRAKTSPSTTPTTFFFNLTGITKSGDNVSFTWRATKNGAPPSIRANDNLSNGPTFRSLGAYLAYAKGDDWVNENISATQGPGQPLGAVNLFTSPRQTT